MTLQTRRERRQEQRRRGGQQPSRGGSGGRPGWIIPAIVVVVAVFAIVVLRAAGVFEPAATAINTNDPKYSGAAGTKYPSEGSTHVPDTQTVTYTTNPPTSGSHWASPAPWGSYDTPLALERTTHNLEHGGIVIMYKGLSNEEVVRLKSIVSGLRSGQYRKIILEPYNGMNDAKVAVSAWMWQSKLQAVDEVEIVKFVKAHYDGPDAPEPGVP